MKHIPEETIYDMVDGELSPEESERVTSHISECEECRRIMSEIIAAEEGIRVLWEEELSKDCPDEETLFAYFEGRLEDESFEAVKRHLDACPVCKATVYLATDSLESFRVLERAKHVIAPSLVGRLRERLEKLDTRKLLESLEKILAPTRLGGELFAFLSKSATALTYPFTSPLEAPALLPLAAGGVKLADTGRGFQRKIIVEPGVPFEIELVQFGERFILNFKALDEAHRESLVKYSLLEAGQMRYQGLVLVSEGKAAVDFNEKEIEALRPEKSPLNLRLEVLCKGDVVCQVKGEDIITLLERLQELLESEDPDVLDTTVGALNKIQDLIPEEH